MVLGVRKAVTNKYIIYTVCFWAFIGPLAYHIASIGQCTVGMADAISQHYPAMAYVRSLWVDVWSALLHGDRFVFPMINFSLGLGENNIAALNYYGLNDPFYMLTALCSEEQLPYFYSGLFYLRIYLGGMAFIAFVSELDDTKSRLAYVMGALVYSFTGFTLQSNMHIIFVHAMLYTPLVLLGAERLMNDRRRGLLCIAVCCFALSGFYFLYIASVSMAVFIIYRLFRKGMTLWQAIPRLCGIFLEYLLGIGLSAVIFVPSVLGFLGSDRSEAEINIPFILSWDEIQGLIKNMFFPSYSNIGQELAICTIGMAALVCILLAKGRRREKLNLIVLLVTAVMPFFSYMMSGFNACYSRWELVIDLYIAFLVVSVWDELCQLTILQKVGIVVVYLVLGLIGRREDILTHERFGKTIISYGLVLCALVVILPLSKYLRRERAGMYILFTVGYITVCMNWKAAARYNHIETVQGRQVVRELIDVQEQREDFFRIENERGFGEPRYGLNVSLLQGYYGTMSYVSITNEYYVQAFEEWDISSTSFNVWGLDQRAVLETMCAVKYFVARTESAGIVPYGFEYVRSTEDGEWSLYENMHALPLVYAYDSVYDVEAYRAMSGLEKQQAMLQAASIRNDTGGGCEAAKELTTSLYGSDYIITGLENARWEDEIIQVEAGGGMMLEVDIRSGSEAYLYFTGDCTQWIEDIDIKNRYVKYGHAISPLAVNLGTSETDKRIGITITFNHATAFDPRTLQVISYDMKNYAEQIEALKRDTDGRFKVKGNSIYGTVDLVQNKILCFAVPYSSGWHARIDGQESETLLVNDLFTGVEAPEGAHEVELYYVTPGIKAGAGISAVSLFFIAGYMVSQAAVKKSKGRL